MTISSAHMLPLLSVPQPDRPRLTESTKIYLLVFASAVVGAIMGAVITTLVLSIR